MKNLSILLAAIFLFFAVSGVSAQSKTRVRFAKGMSSTTVSGRITGFAYKDYVVGASGGQTISIKLTSKNEFAVAVIFLPNGDNLERAAETDQFSGELPATGNYVVRVMMMRAEARRKGSIANYKLRIAIR